MQVTLCHISSLARVLYSTFASRAVLNIRERAAAAQVFSTINPPTEISGMELVTVAGDPDP